jgi:hypothetical protein
MLTGPSEEARRSRSAVTASLPTDGDGADDDVSATTTWLPARVATAMNPAAKRRILMISPVSVSRDGLSW